MQHLQTVLSLIDILNKATPGIASLILMLKGPDGTIGVVALLDQAESGFSDNLAQAKAWLAAHPVKPE